MSENNAPRVNRLPFLIGDLMLLGVAGFIVYGNALPLDFWEAILCSAAVGLAAFFGVWPFLLEYRAAVKFAELDSFKDLAGQVQQVEEAANRIQTASSQWQAVQEQAARTNAAAREITDRMSSEARAFVEFLDKANDTEKATLRLEVDKLQRLEKDWVQVTVRMLDHVYALYVAATKSTQPELARQIGNFQFACRDAARRVGLVPYAAEPGEKFDPKAHSIPDVETPPDAPMQVVETLATGYTFQGQLLRPALVRVDPFRSGDPGNTAPPGPGPGTTKSVSGPKAPPPAS